jgi:hypothetical protein
VRPARAAPPGEYGLKSNENGHLARANGAIDGPYCSPTWPSVFGRRCEPLAGRGDGFGGGAAHAPAHAACLEPWGTWTRVTFDQQCCCWVSESLSSKLGMSRGSGGGHPPGYALASQSVRDAEGAGSAVPHRAPAPPGRMRGVRPAPGVYKADSRGITQGEAGFWAGG